MSPDLISGSAREPFPRHDSEKRILKWYGTTETIEERKKTEFAIRQPEKLAAVGRLASSIAHEINNPLEAVTNLLFLSRMTDDPSAVKGYLRDADREMRRVAMITTQTYVFASNPRIPPANMRGADY
jgi:C4-dicarboxylate-specific signal transduction histidine kinase